MSEGDGPFKIDAVLSPGKSWRATGAGGRAVVLKLLPTDCLQQGRLHPNIQLRLTRLRELPLRSFVNLIGVERLEQGVVLVSEYVVGRSLNEVIEKDRDAAIKKARLAIQSLHALGFIHGNIHGGNVIVEPTGDIRLIDPSPLLHDDPTLDVVALDRLDNGPKTMAVDPISIEPDRVGRRSFAAAIALSVIGLAAAVGLAIHFSG